MRTHRGGPCAQSAGAFFKPIRYWSYERDRWFESPSLQRRVNKLSVPLEMMLGEGSIRRARTDWPSGGIARRFQPGSDRGPPAVMCATSAPARLPHARRPRSPSNGKLRPGTLCRHAQSLLRASPVPLISFNHGLDFPGHARSPRSSMPHTARGSPCATSAERSREESRNAGGERRPARDRR